MVAELDVVGEGVDEEEAAAGFGGEVGEGVEVDRAESGGRGSTGEDVGVVRVAVAAGPVGSEASESRDGGAAAAVAAGRVAGRAREALRPCRR
ncbi:hypothetical protein HS99_0035365 [Kitasatospora aureofaciens]|uniref:Uncharacterized protein n=1 Tax=Kitasatospora aureofaciens TaxID=1894 RepID=A0A1E7N1J8_KITAU|nr:hypothetical protein HS99_0035365 [Kitasatospora aureofaciens]